MRRWVAAALAAAAWLTVVACADPSEPTSKVERSDYAIPTPPKQAVPREVQISTSTWKPGDGSRGALISGALRFSPLGCPYLGRFAGVVWPAGFSSRVEPNGRQVILTPDGRVISEGDTVVASGAAAATMADGGLPCIDAGTTLTLIQSTVEVIPRR
jgi:hypothetical protein